MSIQITEVRNSKEMKRFITFPLRLYENDRHFVFEPVKFQKDFLAMNNPFFGHSDARFFVALSGNTVVGRITAIHNTIHNEIYHENTGFLGFFEVIEYYKVAKLLLDTVREIHAAHGCTRMVGTTSFTTNDTCGILISGFDDDPVFLMPYNKPYYPDLLCKYGFEPLMDLSSYSLDSQKMQAFFNRPLFKQIENKLAANKILFRTINFNNFRDDISGLRQIYNSSNAENWGFIPMTEREFMVMATNLRKLIPEDLIIFAEYNRKIIGFIVAVPDFNQVFQNIRNGRLFPVGWLKFLWFKQKINRARIMILGVDKNHLNSGIDLVLYNKITENLIRMGILKAEACYVMGNNRKMKSILEKMQADEIKRYRMYSYAMNSE